MLRTIVDGTTLLSTVSDYLGTRLQNGFAVVRYAL